MTQPRERCNTNVAARYKEFVIDEKEAQVG
jgi:hypothetical protein